MVKFLWGFACGGATVLTLCLLWYRGKLKPRLDTLKQMAEDKLKEGVDKLRGTF